jgi:hypothetical protein
MANGRFEIRTDFDVEKYQEKAIVECERLGIKNNKGLSKIVRTLLKMWFIGKIKITAKDI